MSPSTTVSRSGSVKDFGTIVTGPGMHMSKAKVNWLIERFDVIMAEPNSLISRQKIELPLDIGDDCPTMWSFYLSYNESDKSVRLNFALKKYPEGRVIFVKIRLNVMFNNILHRRGFVCSCRKIPIGGVSGYGWKIIEKGEWRSRQLGTNNFKGSIKCNISMKAYANWVENKADKIIPQIACDTTTNRKRSKEIDAASQLILDIAKIYKSGATKDILSDFKILTNDGKEFPVHKAVLAARSTVFHAMFHSTVPENQTGVLKLNDVSSAAMGIVLHYVYTGEFHPDASKLSSDGNIAAEIVSASDKYQLTTLRDYFKEIFEEKCANSNPDKLWDNPDKRLAKSKNKSDKKKTGGFLSRRSQQKRCCLQ